MEAIMGAQLTDQIFTSAMTIPATTKITIRICM
jgi:hypothetical protein